MNARSIIILIASLTVFHCSQAQVLVKLTQPPPNQLRAADLWKLTLDNTTRTTFSITLEGTVDEAAAGRVADGQSGILSLPPGRKTITYDDVRRGGSVNFKAGKWRDAFTRTGNAPGGDYTICITVKSEAGEELGKDCIDQRVEISTGPTLVSPADGEVISEGQLPTFTWLAPTPAPRDVTYSLKIVEVQGNQSPSEAMQRNPAWFEKGDIRTTTFQYPASAKKLEKGKKHAWKVTPFIGGQEGGSSDVWMFSQGGCYTINLDSLKVFCTGTLGVYSFTLWFHNLNDPNAACNQVQPPMVPYGSNAIISSWQLTTNPSGGSVSAPPTQPFLYSQTIGHTVSGTISGVPNLSSVLLLVTMADQGSPSLNSATSNVGVNVRSCACCVGFIRHVDSLGVTSTNLSGGLFQLTGSLVAGPNRITKVTAELVYLSDSTNDPNCVKCNTNSLNFGNIQSGTLGTFGAGSITVPVSAPQYAREIIWTSNTPVNMTTGNALSLNLAMPPAKSLYCCSDTLRFCIRYSFTDTSCITCDTLICVKVIRDSLGIRLAMGSSDTDNSWLGELRNLTKNENRLYERGKSVSTAFELGVSKGNNKGQSGTTCYLATPLLVSLFKRKRRRMLSYSSTILARCIKLFVYLILSCILIPVFSIVRAQTNVTVIITSDNAYVFGFGDINGISDYRSPGVCNSSAGEIYNAAPWGPETYPIQANLNGYIYIAAWSDEQTYQGTIAEFTDGNTTILTSPPPPNGPVSNAHWEVYATGINLYPNPSYSTQYTVPRGNANCPSITDINAQISIANSGTGPSASTSIGWVSTTPNPGRHGVLVFGHNNTLGPLSHCNQPYKFPPGQVAGIDPSAQWMWYIPDTSITYPNETGPIPCFPASMSREYYIFRIGPLGELLDTCCKGSKWGDMTYYTISGPPPHKPHKMICGSSYALQCYQPYTINASYSCAQQNCPPIVTYAITSPMGNTTTGNVSFTFTPTQSGIYSMMLYGWCGKSICDSCKITFGVDCPSPSHGCCNNFTTSVISTVTPNAIDNGQYTINATFTAGPNKIKKVSASLVHFSMSYSNPDCERCIKPVESFGSFTSATSLGTTPPFTAALTNPFNTPFPITSVREIIWSDPGGNSTVLLSQNVNIGLMVPGPSSLCCCDTIQLGIRYKFTDTTCVTCDTLIYYKLVQKGKMPCSHLPGETPVPFPQHDINKLKRLPQRIK